MDDTHLSRTSDAAAATRKRRSSILKSQRPPRTPFSELEFNVTTPTDTAKSRRVSFSRRTGVAEFITNEATTTWKNFYEEHNKSHESSGNESGANAPRPIGHIGKRIFDQQFQEVEAVDFGSTLDNHSNRNVNTSINNVNFTQQLASFECTGDDRKLAVPQQNFEMSAFTDHQSKLFGDDLAIPTMGEMSGHIDVNFSAVQTIGEVKDDLDEIQDDIQRVQSNVVCPGPFTGRRSLSEYIEVDLNVTNMVIKNDDDDMSITDTIHSPKVQDVSKSHSSIQIDKNASSSKDWVADKENIVLNPYVAPKESTNFAVNDESDKILVFDGKQLTIQSDKEADKILKSTTGDLQATVHKEPKSHQKNIVLNINDDLPNFIEDPHMLSSNGILTSASFKHSFKYDNDDDITNENQSLEKRKIIQGNDTGNISITQGIPSNIILSKNASKDLESSKTVVFDNMEADISMTQVLPSKIIGSQESKLEPQRRRTILYDNDMGDISITQAIPANILLNENEQKHGPKMQPERRKTILYDNDMGNISMTQVIPANIILNENKEPIKPEPERRKTIIYDEMSNISMTQAIPSNIILNEKKEDNKKDPERRSTILYDDEMSNISITQAIPTNIIVNETKESSTQEPERQKTILYNIDADNISITQAIPTNILLNERKEGENKSESEKRKTIHYDNDLGNVSMTVVISSNILLNDNKDVDRSKTILYENVGPNISMTQAIPSNLLINDISLNINSVKRKTIVFDSNDGDISITKSVPSKILITDEKSKPERKLSQSGNISSIHSNLLVTEKNEVKDEKSRTMEYDKIAGNISLTQTVPNKVIPPKENDLVDKINMASETDVDEISFTRAIPTNIFLPNEKCKTTVYEEEASNITNIKCETSAKHLEEKIHNIVSSENVRGISITNDVPSDVVHPKEKHKMRMSDNEAVNISFTQTRPQNLFKKENFEVSKIDLKDKIDILTSETSIGDYSSSCAVPSDITLTKEKRKTIVKEEDKAGNISLTRILPTHTFGVEKSEILDKRKTFIYESNVPEIAVTQALLVNVLIVNNATENRKSIMYDTEAENALAEKSKATPENENIDEENEPGNLSEDQKIPEIGNEILPESSTTENDFKDDLIENMSLNATRPTDRPTDLISEEKPEVIDTQITSSDNLIYIIRDIEDETQTDKTNKSLTWKDDVPKIQHSPLSLEYKEDVDAEVTADLPKKLDELKSLVNEKKPTMNRHYEKIISSDQESDRLLQKSESQDRFEISKSFQDANDTNELLEMLSDLTEKNPSKEAEKPVEKIKTHEPRRVSVAPNRLSIVLSREDLMNNISMAQAALQKSLETDESIDDTVSDTPDEVSVPSKKTVRVSNEVVKKLQFEEDESASDASIKSDMKGSPLKKTAFGETTYIKDCKAKVIPSYLKDVSDELKALMNDLVKPNVDSLTLQIPPTDISLKRDPSTCSTQIQANLIASSQIDLDTELNSITDSGYELEKASMRSGLSIDRFHTRRSKSPESDEPHGISFRPKREMPSSPSQDRVIVFDHQNPLNNILLVPLDFSDVHRYNPHKSNETLCADSQSVHSVKEVDSKEKTNTHFVGTVLVQHAMQPSGDSVPDKSDAQSLLSTTSKPMSIDESVSVERACELKDTEVNTIIAMKANKELLKTSSSLTLVDDALAQSAFDVDLDMVNIESSTNDRGNSPVKLIYHNDEKDVLLSERASDFTSTDEIMEPVKIGTKGKKRNYSPTKKDKHKYCPVSSLDITPKQITKMQKLSNSPKYKVQNAKDESFEKLTAEKDENVQSKSAMEVDESSDAKESPKERKRSLRKSKSPKPKKPGTSVTVQQLLTKYDIQPNIDQDALNKQIIEALSRSDSSTAPNTLSLTDVESKSPDVVSSFTSSKNQNEMREALSVMTTESRTLSSQSRSGKGEWQPEVVKNTSCNVSRCESSVNVVAKIDMLPFMGSHECEWEASGIDTWSFRLLHGRLRLAVRLAHRHDNATRTRVRADTPVHHVAVDTAHADNKNSVATVCVGLALETMRYFVERGCSKAGDVPALLRRCAGVARVALRWGRAMHEARQHLAYTLTNDGCLSLKVANIPLRSVWEVSMRVELVAEPAGSAPWPRAGAVRVARVVSDVRVPDAAVQRALAPLPRDWGHAPRAVWKIFKYLKNLTREDELLGV